MNTDLPDQDAIDRKIDRYLKYGWCPLPWKHHPPHIKAAIKAARMVPKMKGCFENSQRLILADPSLTYVEGWIQSPALPIPIEHAWVMDAEGRHHDVTLQTSKDAPQPRRLLQWTAPTEEVRRVLIERRTFGPIRTQQFHASHMEAFKEIGMFLEPLDLPERVPALHQATQSDLT